MGALRAEATTVDTSIVSRRRHPREPRTGIVDLGAVFRAFEDMGGPGDGG